MQNRLPAIIGGIVSLLITGICCLSGIGLYFYQTFAARALMEAPTFQPSPTLPPPSGIPSTDPLAVLPSASASTTLRLGSGASNYGVGPVSPGANPPPVSIVSGATQTSSVDFSTLGIQPVNPGSCRGYGTAQPDYILDVTSPVALVNLVVTSDGDPTLVIHHAGRFWCSDDDGDGLNPLVQLTTVEPGQYDVWVGSYSGTQNINTTLTITQ